MKCCRCKKELPETEFYSHKTNMRGYQWECKLCRAEMQREYYQKNKDRILAYNREYNRTHKKQLAKYDRVKRLKKYNLTPEQYDQMVEAQKGSCAICKIPIEKPDIDHNHQTGKTRGVLCPRCNHGLGFVENKRFHETAEAYLERYK